MFWYRSLPFLYMTSHTIFYTISYVECTISYAKHTISYTTSKKIAILYVLVQIFAIFVYDIAYDIVYNIVILADIVYDMQKSFCYYTISYVYIVCTIAIIRYHMPVSIKTYDDTVGCRI